MITKLLPALLLATQLQAGILVNQDSILDPKLSLLNTWTRSNTITSSSDITDFEDGSFSAISTVSADHFYVEMNLGYISVAEWNLEGTPYELRQVYTTFDGGTATFNVIGSGKSFDGTIGDQDGVGTFSFDYDPDLDEVIYVNTLLSVSFYGQKVPEIDSTLTLFTLALLVLAAFYDKKTTR